MNKATRFARLFQGYTKRYGRYDLGGEAGVGEKRAGQARTVDGELTQDIFDAHVKGKIGMGVIPLLDDSENVHFASIDVDVYKPEEQQQRNLTHSDIAVALIDEPLFVSRSKSDGVHVWLFSAEGVNAALAVDYLNTIAARLGVAGSEVFPKQTSRASDEDVGNWINLPYYGKARNAVIPDDDGTLVNLVEATLDQFLDLAEIVAKSVTNEWLIENTIIPESQRTGQDVGELWYDGPPCLQRLFHGQPERLTKLNRDFEDGRTSEEQYKRAVNSTKPQLGEGNRNNAFFNLAMYLRRRMTPQDCDGKIDEDQRKLLQIELQRLHDKWTHETGEQGISPELPRISQQMKSDRWGYACTKEPLKALCNRRTCLKRQFGVGTAKLDQPMEITGFAAIMTSDPQFVFTLNGKRVYIPDAKSLLNQHIFAEEVTKSTLQVWPMLPNNDWSKLIHDLLEKRDEIAPPPDTDLKAIIGNALLEFISTKKIPKGQNDASFHSGRVIWTDDECEAWFRMNHFMNFLRNEKVVGETERSIANMIKDEWGVIARPNTTLGGRQVRPYVVNIAELESKLTGDEADG